MIFFSFFSFLLLIIKPSPNLTSKTPFIYFFYFLSSQPIKKTKQKPLFHCTLCMHVYMHIHGMEILYMHTWWYMYIYICAFISVCISVCIDVSTSTIWQLTYIVPHLARDNCPSDNDMILPHPPLQIYN